MNHHAKFDAASLILGGEINNRTNRHTQNYKRAVTGIYTPCLSARVDETCGGLKLLSVTEFIENSAIQ